MIHWTVGSGGTHANWGQVSAALFGASPLADDYDIVQISNVTEGYLGNAFNVDPNGHTVTMRNSSPHGGDPNVGYRVSSIVDNVRAIFLRMIGAGRVVVQDLNFSYDAGGGVAAVYVALDADCDVDVHDVIGRSGGLNGSLVAVLGNAPFTSAVVRVWNCAASGWANGLELLNAGTGQITVENYTALNAGSTGVFVDATGPVTVRNVVATSAGNDFSGTGVANGYNNASADATADDSNWLAGSGNLTGIVPANEFVSQDYTSSDFAKLQGPPALALLYHSGIAPTLPENTEGIRGTARPHYVDGVGFQTSIGADEVFVDPPPPPPSGGGTTGGGGISPAVGVAIAAGRV